MAVVIGMRVDDCNLFDEPSMNWGRIQRMTVGLITDGPSPDCLSFPTARRLSGWRAFV
jgi:hypothetical protein